LSFGFWLLAFALGCEAFCLWLLPFAFGILVWEAFGREKNYLRGKNCKREIAEGNSG
jgi:hypothetical protein